MAAGLRAAGYEAQHLIEAGLRGKPDDQVFAHCLQTASVLVSGDLGFANSLQFSIGSHSGIVIARIPNEISTVLSNQLVIDAIRDSLDDLPGSLLIVEPGKHRLRKER